METISYPFPPRIAEFLARVGSRKRKAFVSTHSCKPRKLMSYWSGGSITEYTAFNSKGGILNIPVGTDPFRYHDTPEWTPSPGDVLVTSGTSCGKPATPHIIFFE